MNFPDAQCEHLNTIIWEPHLAGARKCTSCGMVKSPNRAHFGGKLWDFEPMSDKEKIEKMAGALRRAAVDLDWCGDNHSDSFLSHGAKCAEEIRQTVRDLGFEVPNQAENPYQKAQIPFKCEKHNREHSTPICPECELAYQAGSQTEEK